jgi:hypothetical protein
VRLALQEAESRKFAGIDRDLQWAYDHPWKKP